MARTGQSGPGRGKPRLALMMSLRQKLEKGQPASADYLRFCSKEKLPRDVRRKRDKYISCLAAYHGHLPLLQELLEPWSLHVVQDVTRAAGEFSFSQSRLLLVLASDLFLVFSSSQRAEANWRSCSG